MAHQGFDHENSDRLRANPAMQNPNSMTIEFLRARLLAERAVSKSARDKVDELAKKVVELEEQLKIVSLQRKKAEKATADVLAILEENGFTDISERYDSSSDDESSSQTNSGRSSAKVEERSVDSKVRSNEMDELSASELDSFPESGSRISWKGRKSEPSSLDKVKESRTRRQRSFESVHLSSPRTRQGKSCRQIRRRESRSVVEDSKRHGNAFDLQESRITNSDMLSGEAPKTVPDAIVLKEDENLQKVLSSNCLEKENNMDINLERALENRARVIGCFEDLERTQREWEQKFRESNISALDLCDPGNHSDVTDESNETKTEVQHQGTAVVPLSVHEATSKTNIVDAMESCQTPSHASPGNSVTSLDKQCPAYVSKSLDQGISLQEGTAKYIAESPKSECSRPQSCSSGFFEHSSSPNLSTLLTQRKLGSASMSRTGAYPLVPMAQNSSACDTVLTALRQARLSLQEKVNSPHLAKAGNLAEGSCSSVAASRITTCTLPPEPAFGIKAPFSASMVGPMAEVPVGCAGLFRVPTDFSADASMRNSFLASSSQKHLVSYIPENDISLLLRDHLSSETSTKIPTTGFQSHLLDTAAAHLTTGERLPTTPHIGGSKLWTGFSADDPLIDDAQRLRLYKSSPSVSDSHISSATYAWEGNRTSPTSFSLDSRPNMYLGTPNVHLPSTSSLSSYHDTKTQLGTERFSAPYTTSSAGLPPVDHLGNDSFRRGVSRW